MTCEHTFGTYDNQCDSGYFLIYGVTECYAQIRKHPRDVELFTYCPDCGILLAPIISEVKERDTIAAAIKRVFPK